MNKPVPTVSPRLGWVDAFKGIGILLVVVGHTSRIPGITQFVYSFHMPMFFWISGYLFSVRPFPDFVRRKARTLLVPYFFFGVFTWLFWAFIEYDYSDHIGDALPALANLMVGQAGNATYSADPPLWFLLCLFMAEIAFLGLLHMARGAAHRIFSQRGVEHRAEWLRLSIVGIASVGSAVGGAVLIDAKLTRLPWTLDIVPVALAFMGAGYVSRAVAERVRQNQTCSQMWDEFRLCLRLGRRIKAASTGEREVLSRKYRRGVRMVVWGALLPLGISFAVDMLLCHFGVHVDLANGVMRIPWAAFVAALAMIGSVVIVARYFSPRWLRYLGHASIVVLTMHIVVKHEVLLTLSTFTGIAEADLQTSPAWVALASTCVLGISLVLYEMVRAMMPYAIGKPVERSAASTRWVPEQVLSSLPSPILNGQRI